MDKSTTGISEEEVTALTQREDSAFKEMTDYFIKKAQNKDETLEPDTVHHLFRTWLQTRVARLLQTRKVMGELMQLLEDKKFTDKINADFSPSEILKLQVSSSLASINSDGDGTWGMLYLIIVIFGFMRDSSEFKTKMSEYAPYLEQIGKAFKEKEIQTAGTTQDPLEFFQKIWGSQKKRGVII